MKTVLVTGGAGFIGCNFVRRWLAEEEDALVNLDKLTYAGNLDSLADVADHRRHLFLHGDIGGGADKKQVEDAFKAGMLDALSAGGERAPEESVQVEVTDSGESPDYFDVTLRLRPPFNILGQSADLLLGLPLRK